MNIFWAYEPVDGGIRMRWVQEFHMKDDAPVDDAQMTDRINHNSKIQMGIIKRRHRAARPRARDGGLTR